MDQSAKGRPKTFRAWVDFAVEQLGGWAATRQRRLPTWDRIVVTEEENGQRTGQWVSVDEFEPRFTRILERTTRTWVNLHVDPIEAGALCLVVEYISRADKSAVRVSPERISVNYSGPLLFGSRLFPSRKRPVSWSRRSVMCAGLTAQLTA
jgi:hypothetical protein